MTGPTNVTDLAKRRSIYAQEKQRYVEAGYQPRPVAPGTKQCRVKGWQRDVSDVREPRGRDCGLGLRLGTRLADGTFLVALDADRDDLVRLARALVPSPCGRVGSKGIALFARTSDPVAKFDLKLADGNKAGELLGAKSLCVIPPTVHPDTGQPYRWVGKPLLEVSPADLPLLDPAFVRAAFTSEHLPGLMSGGATHDAALRLVAQLARLSEDGGYIERVVAAYLPADYAGNTLKELPGMVRDALRKYETGEWERAVHDAKQIDERLAELNRDYMVVQDGGKTRVLRFDPQVQTKDGRVVHRRLTPTFLSFGDFHNYFKNEHVLLAEDKSVPLGQWWTSHPQRRTYLGITFRPDVLAEEVDGRLNLWRGWGVEPKAGDWSLMRRHILEVLASGNDDWDAYIVNWMAWAVQHPADRAEVALVLKGGRGVGKGTLGNALVHIFGQHATHISSVDHLAGRFNAHLRDACFLFADEAYWPGDKSAEGTLKRLITEPTLFIEQKGRDGVTVINMLHVFMASNEDWVVPAGEHERRYAVFQVSEQKRQDQDWFKPLYEQLENGGYEAMLHDLLRRDLGNWHPRDIPMTEALRDQQRHSVRPEDAWLLTFLEAGMLPRGDDVDGANRALSRSQPDFEGRNPRNGLYDLAREQLALRRTDEQVLAKYLKNWGCKPWRNAQVRGWEFPPLAECRGKWEAKYPNWQWQHPELTEWGDIGKPDWMKSDNSRHPA
jgi:hypothetical protein